MWAAAVGRALVTSAGYTNLLAQANVLAFALLSLYTSRDYAPQAALLLPPLGVFAVLVTSWVFGGGQDDGHPHRRGLGGAHADGPAWLTARRGGDASWPTGHDGRAGER
jgi:hypothetical protein